MDCRDVRSLADSYLSGQLLVETTHAVVEHLERCPACRAELDGRRRLRAALREAFDRAPDLQPRPEFLERVRVQLGERAATASAQEHGDVSSARPRGRWPRWRGLAVAAGAVLTLGLGAGGALWIAGDTLGALAARAAGDHQDCALRFRLSERPIPLSEAAVRFDRAFGRLEALDIPREALRHGSLAHVERHACVYDGQPFAHIVLSYRGTAVSVLVPDRDGLHGDWWRSREVTGLPGVGRFNLASFRSGDHMVFVVSTLPPSDLREVAQAIAPSMEQALSGS